MGTNCVGMMILCLVVRVVVLVVLSISMHAIHVAPAQTLWRRWDLAAIDTAISSERELLAKDLTDYKYSTGDRLEALLMEKGGSPVRAMVVSTWRSGSTFLGIT